MNEPSFLSVAQRDHQEEHKCPEGATERCERDFLRVAPCVGNSNAIPRESLSLCEAMDLTTGHWCIDLKPLVRLRADFRRGLFAGGPRLNESGRFRLRETNSQNRRV